MGVQVIPQYDLGERFGAGFGEGLQKGVSSGLETLQTQLQQKRETTAIEDMAKKWSDKTTNEEKIVDISKLAISKETKKGVTEALVKLNKQEQKKLSDKEKKLFKDYLTRTGLSEEDAESEVELYDLLTTGGQTEKAKHMLDAQQRRISKMETNKEATEGGKFPKINPFAGKTPKGRDKMEAEFRKENRPIYNESSKKLRSLVKEDMAFQTMERLSEHLPTGLGRLNITSDGQLVIPSLAGAKTEQFVKELNNFAKKAKDSFAGRVTNFELQTHMKTFPSLFNSHEGRMLILRQLRIVNEMDRIHEEEVQKVYEHYGLGKIPLEKANRIAENNIQPEINKLELEYQDVKSESARENKRNMLEEEKKEEAVPMISPNGKPMRIPKSRVQEALDSGGKMA